MLYFLLRFTFVPLIKKTFRTKIEGKHNLPKSPAILAANHTDAADPAFVSMITRRRIYFLAKHDLLDPHVKTRNLLRFIKTVRVEKGKGKSQEAIDKAAHLLKNKRCYFAIFPEGTIEGGEKILKGHTGVARISLQAEVPIVPIAIKGIYGAWKNQSYLPDKLKKVTIRIGNPLYFKEYYGQQNNRKITRKVTDRVMEEIKKLYKEE